jgi:drug/metabolite transporter superfamily protein YnfA
MQMKIPLDKQLHLFSGWALCASLLPFVGLAWALFGTVFVGAVKELVWDWTLKKGTPDRNDFFATAAGALIGVAFYLTTTVILSHAERF